MATTYNIVEKRYNGTDYDTLYPATKGENLVSPVPVELGGTGATTGAAGMKNLLDALSTVTPTGADLLPLKVVSGNIAGKATIDSILSLVSGGAKIQTGSYVGTGTYGQDNPCSLTFDFEPKWAFISEESATGQALNGCGVAFFNNESATYTMGYGVTGSMQFAQSNPTYFVSIWNNKSLSWYGTAANNQLNIGTSVYRYVCIG